VRSVSGVLCTLLLAATATAAMAESSGVTAVASRRLIDAPQFRPGIALHAIAPRGDAGFVTITGVVFSRSPIDRVTVGERAAVIRPAEAEDLNSLDRVPEGAAELPFRTFFEVPDAALGRVGANDLEIVAVTAEGRTSDIHRLTIVRAAERADTDN